MNKNKYNEFLYCSLLVVFLAGCTGKKINIPEAVLQPAEMKSILVDVHVAQAAIGIHAVNDSVQYSLEDYLAFIYKNHHTNREQFDSSMKFYASNPEMLDSIYKDVIEDLSKRQGQEESRGKPN